MKEDLERLVWQMYKNGVQYSEAVREFQKTFLSTVLQNNNGNQVKAAEKLGIHRNTLRRQIREFDLDLRLLHAARRPAASESALNRPKRIRAPEGRKANLG